jgi:hypothetical protein
LAQGVLKPKLVVENADVNVAVLKATLMDATVVVRAVVVLPKVVVLVGVSIQLQISD